MSGLARPDGSVGSCRDGKRRQSGLPAGTEGPRRLEYFDLGIACRQQVSLPAADFEHPLPWRDQEAVDFPQAAMIFHAEKCFSRAKLRNFIPMGFAFEGVFTLIGGHVFSKD